MYFDTMRISSVMIEDKGMLKQITLALIFFTIAPLVQSAQSLDAIVAEVNDGVITKSELNAQVNDLILQMKARQMPVPDETTLRKQVLQQLIDTDLMLQLAKKSGLKINSDELNKAIEGIAHNNKLTSDELRKILGEQGMSWKAYKDTIRKEMLITRIQQQHVKQPAAEISKEQIDAVIKAANKEKATMQAVYHVKNLVVPLSSDASREEVEKARKKALDVLAKMKKGSDVNEIAIQESSNEFMLVAGDLGERQLAQLPEIFAKAVVQMQAGEYSQPLRAPNGFQLIQLVSKTGDNQQHIVKKTHVRHILIKQTASMTQEDTKKQLNNLYQQLKSGKDFATAAKEYSVDVSTASKGGDLGWVNQGELVPPFEKVMNELPLNTVSRPVKTQFGWHMIQVLERKEVDDTVAFQQQQARQWLQQKKFAEAVQTWQKRLRAESYIHVLDKTLA